MDKVHHHQNPLGSNDVWLSMCWQMNDDDNEQEICDEEEWQLIGHTDILLLMGIGR
jgi:hypothetical protein